MTREGNAPGKLLEEPATKTSVAEKCDSTWGAGPEEMLRNAAAQDDGSADNDLDTIRKPPEEILKTPKSEDMDETESDRPEEMPENATQ